MLNVKKNESIGLEIVYHYVCLYKLFYKDL